MIPLMTGPHHLAHFRLWDLQQPWALLGGQVSWADPSFTHALRSTSHILTPTPLPVAGASLSLSIPSLPSLFQLPLLFSHSYSLFLYLFLLLLLLSCQCNILIIGQWVAHAICKQLGTFLPLLVLLSIEWFIELLQSVIAPPSVPWQIMVNIKLSHMYLQYFE